MLKIDQNIDPTPVIIETAGAFLDLRDKLNPGLQMHGRRYTSGLSPFHDRGNSPKGDANI